MRETLYLRLGQGPDDDVEFAVAGEHLRSLRSSHGRLEQAAQLAPGRTLVVFVPSGEVQVTTASVPGRQAAKILQAIPYALEDQFADDVESLHFSIGRRLADGTLPVAVVARERIGQWLETLRTQGLRPARLIPETLSLPVDAAQRVQVLLRDGEAVVRHDGWSSFCCPADSLGDYLALLDPEHSATACIHDAERSGRDWSAFGWQTALKPAPGALHVLVNHLDEAHSINLLQGDFSEREDLRRHWAPWRLAAALLFGWVLVAGLGRGLEAMRLGHEVQRLDQANITRYQQVFPEEQRIANLEAQLEQKLRGLQGGHAGGPLPLFEVLSEALAASPGLKLTGVQYRDQSLYLSMSAADLQVLDKLRQWFEQQPGFTLDVQSANAESGGAQIRARVVAA